MKMARNLLILLGVVALAVAAVLLLPKIAPKEETVTPMPTTPYEQLLLSDRKSDDVSRITIDNENGRIVYYYDAQDDLWKIEGHEDIGIDQRTAGDIAYTAAYISGRNVIMDDLSNLPEYGLDDPSVTVLTEFRDGSNLTLYIGDSSPSRQTHYAYVEGIPRVVDLWMNYSRNFNLKLDDLRLVGDLPQMAAETIVKVRLERKGEDTLQLAIEDTADNVSIFTWYVQEPWHHLCDTEQLNTFLGNVAALKLDEVAAGDPGDLAQYGLADPAMTLTVQNNEWKTYTLRIGDKTGGSAYYCMVGDDPVVYEIEGNLVDSLDVEPFTMTNQLLSLIQVDNVDAVSFSGLNERADFTIEHVQALDDEGNARVDTNGDPVIEQEYRLDGAEINRNAGVEFYQACLAVRLHSPIGEDFTIRGAPAATLTYQLNKGGSAEYVIEFYEYEKDYYAISINGAVNFKTLREEVRNLVTVIQGVRNGDYDKED